VHFDNPILLSFSVSAIDTEYFLSPIVISSSGSGVDPPSLQILTSSFLFVKSYSINFDF